MKDVWAEVGRKKGEKGKGSRARRWKDAGGGGRKQGGREEDSMAWGGTIMIRERKITMFRRG
jgi:hypothetical protein